MNLAGKLTHAEVTKVREERMSPFVQSSEKSPEQAREVAAEGAEDDGQLPSFLHQVSEQLEEGGQDPVVEPSVLSCHSQLSVPLQGTQSRHQLMAHVPRQRLPHTHTRTRTQAPVPLQQDSELASSCHACLDTVGPEQQVQVLLQDGAEASACSRGEAHHPPKAGVVRHSTATGGQQGGAVAEPFPPTWRHTRGRGALAWRQSQFNTTASTAKHGLVKGPIT